MMTTIHGVMRVGLRTVDLFEQTFSTSAVRSYIIEFVCTFIFVFVGVGSAISAGKLTSYDLLDETGLVVLALAHGFALFVTVYMAVNISGGHVNPAVTFAMVIGGHVSVPTGIFYWLAQLLGSTMSCLVWMLMSSGHFLPVHGLASEIGWLGATTMEALMTFTLVCAVYASRDPKKGTMGPLGPVAIGLVVSGGILAVGPFTGCSMNPARSFGPALVTSNFKNHSVYWVGPLVGAGFAALVFENLMYFLTTQSSNPIDV